MELFIYLAVFIVALAASFFVIKTLRGDKSDKSKDPNSIKSPNTGKNGKEAASATAPPAEPIYGPIHIFYASQTGNAQNLAKTLGNEAIQHGFVPEIIDLGTCETSLLKEAKLAIFSVSTYGEGEPPESCKPFDEWMTSSERTGDEVKGMKFTVFALGNRQYQFYCEQGRKTDKCLEKMGGERVYKLGEGDDNESLEDDFNAWKENIWQELKKHAIPAKKEEGGVQLKRQQSKVSDELPFKVVYKPEEKGLDVIHYDSKDDSKVYNFQAKQYLAASSASVTTSRELRQKTEDGSTLHVEVDISGSELSYITAQNLAVYPENTSDVVERAGKLLGVELDTVFTLEELENSGGHVKFEHPFPTPISIRDYLAKFCDLQGAPKKKQLKDLAQFCGNPDHKKQLQLLASPEGKTEYEVQIHSRLKGIIDVIEEFGVKVPFENLVSIASPILPRHYTIASSNKRDPKSVHLCVSIYADRRPDLPVKYGLTSAFLTEYHEKLAKGKKVPEIKVAVLNSTFVLPTDSSIPLVMIGPGAGIAPFKGFIEEKKYLVENNKENPYGEMTLFFGCRGRDWDNLYREEFLKLAEEKILENFHVAFSREKDQKFYVQDMIEQEKKTITKVLFEQNGTVYLCGSMAMGKAVVKRLGEIVSAYYNCSAAEGEQRVVEMEKQKRINKELWG